jgi:hypothetical protein
MSTHQLDDIIYNRVPYFIWDIIGYVGALVAIYYYNKLGIFITSCSYVSYSTLNSIFDILTITFDYSNETFPTHDEMMTNNNISKLFIITNKTYEFNDHINNSKLKMQLTIYPGNNNIIHQLLSLIYRLGITKKNYVINKEIFLNLICNSELNM